VRVPLGLGHRLHETVFNEHGAHENVAFCLVSHFQEGPDTVLLVRHVIALEESDYTDDATVGAMWQGRAMLPVIELAMNENLGILLVHAHAFGSPPRLSLTDLETTHRLLPMFQRRVPTRPHGSIVVSTGNAGGVVALPNGHAVSVDVSVTWLGSSIIQWPDAGSKTADDQAFDRQALVVGEQDFLTRARVGVIGLCGGGSHFVQQLAHMGTGTIVGVDDDVCEITNLQRLVGMRREDAVRAMAKTDLFDDRVRLIDSGSRFIGVHSRIPRSDAIDALRQCDVLVGCVDTLHVRAQIQQLAWRYLIPYVDVGVGIHSLGGRVGGARASVGGNVFVLIPGGYCMWCCGFLSKEKIDEELGGRAPSYFQNGTGEAQVVSFNGVVASQGTAEILQLLTGFRGASLDPASLSTRSGEQRGVLKYDGLRGTLEEWGGRPDVRCQHCSADLGAGAVAWAPARRAKP
jgi:hypothetical protein